MSKVQITNPNDMVSRAILLATKTHFGVVDKIGAPYIFHPIRVMLEFNDPIDQCVAVLHDVVEDSLHLPEPVTIEQIRAEFGEEVAEGVDAMSQRKTENEQYYDFIRRCMISRRGRRVKLMDINDNRRPERWFQEGKGLAGRYVKATAMIVDALKDGSVEDIEFLYEKKFIAFDEKQVLMRMKEVPVAPVVTSPSCFP